MGNTTSNQTVAPEDVAAIGKHVAAFAVAGLFLVFVAGTPAYPLALGVLIIAIIYTGVSGGLGTFLGNITSFVTGS